MGTIAIVLAVLAVVWMLMDGEQQRQLGIPEAWVPKVQPSLIFGALGLALLAFLV